MLTLRDTNPGTPSTFGIFETNLFKQLTHLELGLRGGTDSTTRRYLASRLAQVSAASARLQRSLEAHQAEMETLRSSAASLREYLWLT